ncbi:MAG: hypothetical protein RMK84_19575 [Oscillochloridaceae bacterium]|nr:hypothetical protein [Chloroflexaceae bacterium]MDW8392328.1 hypothetical protein [Oscillochloridaceae bacterium]
MAYNFHLSPAYRLMMLDDAEEEQPATLAREWQPRFQAADDPLALTPPLLTGFDDMTRSVPLAEAQTLMSRRPTRRAR